MENLRSSNKFSSPVDNILSLIRIPLFASAPSSFHLKKSNVYSYNTLTFLVYKEAVNNSALPISEFSLYSRSPGTNLDKFWAKSNLPRFVGICLKFQKSMSLKAEFSYMCVYRLELLAFQHAEHAGMHWSNSNLHFFIRSICRRRW